MGTKFLSVYKKMDEEELETLSANPMLDELSDDFDDEIDGLGLDD